MALSHTLRTEAIAHRQMGQKRDTADIAGSKVRRDPPCSCSSHNAHVAGNWPRSLRHAGLLGRSLVLLFLCLAQRWFKISICRGPECGDRRGSSALFDAFQSALQAAGSDNCEITWQSCFGRCTQGPNVLVREVVGATAPEIGSGFATPPGPRGATALYNRMDNSRVRRVVAGHVVGGEIIREFIERPGILYSQAVGSKEKDPS